MEKDCQRCEVHFARTLYYAMHHCLLLFTAYFGLATEITGIRAKADVLLCLQLKTLRTLLPSQNRYEGKLASENLQNTTFLLFKGLSGCGS